jgi:hypothetical protein
MLNLNDVGYISAMLQIAKQAKDVDDSELQLAFIEEANEIYNSLKGKIVEAKVIPFKAE